MIPKNNITKLIIPWNVFDLLIVFFIVISIAFITVGLLYIVQRENIYKWSNFIFPFIFCLVPYLWIKKKYNINIEYLGLTIGKYSIREYCFIGLLTAVIFTFSMNLIPIWEVHTAVSMQFSLQSFFVAIVIPFTMLGACKIILTPIGEEILFRGFCFAYFKKKYGPWKGLFLQALFSASLHLIYVDKINFNSFGSEFGYQMIVHFILGFLYEKNRSLYPSMICHGIINYFAILIAVLF